MPTILKIGYRTFLLPKETDAARVLALLAGAMQLEYTYKGGQEIYFPLDSADELALKFIKPTQIVQHKPGEEPNGHDIESVVILDAHKALRKPGAQKLLRFNGS